MRIGHGFDIHCFEPEKPLMLGGVHIPFPQGMKAHSDGDVLLHALCDALLGALALGDIGQHFPDTDPEFRLADSRQLLRNVLVLIESHGYVVENIDATVIAQVPKLSPYIEPMRVNIAHDLTIDTQCVSIKATTMEKLGPIGAGQAIAVHAVVLLKRKTEGVPKNEHTRL